jgi:hypothetical protein
MPPKANQNSPELPFVAFTDAPIYHSYGGFGWKITVRGEVGETPESFINRIVETEELLKQRGFQSSRHKKPSQADPEKPVPVDSDPRPKEETDRPVPIGAVAHEIEESGEEVLVLFDEHARPVSRIGFDGFVNYVGQELGENTQQQFLDALWKGEPVHVNWVAWFLPGKPKPSRFHFPEFIVPDVV